MKIDIRDLAFFVKANLQGLINDNWNTPAGRYFSYHNNVVCKVNDNKKEFSLDDCGWTGKSSTTRTLNCYKRYFTSLGYTEVK